MKSPYTGNEMKLMKEHREIVFRKESFGVLFHFWLCEASSEQFTSTELDEINLRQAYNQFRTRHKLPFPDEIQEIRQQYGLSAAKMSEIMGFGANGYRHYEQGEVPNESNARLIQLARDPERFKNLVELSDALGEKALSNLLARIEQLQRAKTQDNINPMVETYLLGSGVPDEFSGFRRPQIKKFAAMVEAFSVASHPWKTKLNKLLFYADFLHFSKTCSSISGMRYDAIQFGPVPHNFQGIYQFLGDRGLIRIEYVEYENGSIGERFSATGFAFDTILTPEELTTIATVIKRFGNATTQEMVFVSHLEKAWKENVEERRPSISYLKYGFGLDQV